MRQTDMFDSIDVPNLIKCDRNVIFKDAFVFI